MGERRIIGYMNSNVIAFHNVDKRPRYLSVESEYLVAKARSYIDRNFVDGQTEFPLRTPAQGGQQREQED
jgi:hypothetical protein